MRHALDAVPSIVMVMDDDARVFFRNKAAAELLAGEDGRLYGTRAGELMHCIHSDDVSEGCGSGPSCADCVIRGSVSEALAGTSVKRRRLDITVKHAGIARGVSVLISASPFSYGDRLYAIVVLEDISELVEMRSLLPICSSCKRIRSSDGVWERVEVYIKQASPDVNLSHGLCPDCARSLYPKTAG